MGDSEKIVALEESIDTVKKEVDALQVAVMKTVVPWYRQLATLIALLAFLVSLGTTAVSYYRTARLDIVTARVELRGLIEKMTQLPFTHSRMVREFATDTSTLAGLSADINTQNLILAQQAHAMINYIESSTFGKGSVLAEEYMAVAKALQSSFRYDDSENLVREAMSRAGDPTSATGAMRMLAGFSMLRQDSQQMRAHMAKARAIFEEERFKSVDQLTQDVTNATTELQWAGAELMLGECTKVLPHVNEAKPLVTRLPESPLRGQLMQQLLLLEEQLSELCKETPK